ncbi:DL-glycerol-3-phosphatase [Coemansia sp. RSA 1813]|nr:DL-glycerol-3-phosphatase [Coemansia sp. RSA 1646]KAJ1769318.1 DL-glycerol-3-phosphatase [Coemansia sp. RSA 1843]KAJ2089110.1 DL-glycerol-3-phosphatase [Coemansia sp. RSA 986]KAJ2215632.1 DL-glycerol-3-phosphatase [Coemansia sp. RSA 487]KAJ2568824.1 DL-glycerol-3-phosphatase [Coemansia sp. RSA 1813]
MLVDIKAKAILFDMDGTLVNTIECVEKWWRRLAAQHGVDAAQLLATIHGCPTYEVLCQCFPESMHTREEAQRFERQVMVDGEGVHMVPGALAAVRALSDSQWAIVTAATHELAAMRLAQVGLPEPTHLVAAHSVQRGKPFPDCYELAARVLHVEPHETVVFEDSVNGVKAGVAAGAVVVGILSSTPETLLREAGASYIVRDFTAVNVASRDGILTISIDESSLPLPEAKK